MALDSPVLAREITSTGKMGIQNRRIYLPEMKKSNWYLLLKSFIGVLASHFELITVKQVIKAVIPEWVRMRITELEEYLEKIMQHVRVIETENYKLKMKIGKTTNRKVAWGGAFTPKSNFTVGKTKRRDLKWVK